MNRAVRNRLAGGRRELLFAVLALFAGGCTEPAKPTEAESPQPSGDDAPPTKVIAPVAEEWYVPVEADFRPVYDGDADLKARQSWDDYWSWVLLYYNGNFFDRGWRKQAQELVGEVGSPAVKGELRAELNRLSRRVAAEWSKDNDIRKIETTDLRSYGTRLKAAKAKDGGTGDALRREIAAMRTEIEAKLGRN